jgi:cephalosporin-C deacetylase-like acetyl esterase
MKAMRTALETTDHPALGTITLHSLMRGTAQACLEASATLQEVMEMGTCTSSVVHTYIIRRVITKAPACIRLLLSLSAAISGHWTPTGKASPIFN